MGIPDVNNADWSSIDVLKNFSSVTIFFNDGEVVEKRVDNSTIYRLSNILGDLRKSKNFYAINFIYRSTKGFVYRSKVHNSYKIPIKTNSIRITKSNYIDNLSFISYIRLYSDTEGVFIRRKDGAFLWLYGEDVFTCLLFSLDEVKHYLKQHILNKGSFSVKVIDISGKEHNYNY